MGKEYLTIKEAAKYLRVSKDTLRRWEKRKILKPFRSPTGWRYYSKRQLEYVFIQKPDFSEPKTPIQEQPQSVDRPVKITRVYLEPPKSLIAKQSRIRRLSILFLVFFLSFNLILIAFYVAQNTLNR